MKLIRKINSLKTIYKDCVLTIGNFDGMHYGHQALLSNICSRKKMYGGTTIVILFEPHPIEFLDKKNAPLRIMTFRDKVNYLKKWKIDIVVCISFNRKIALMTSEYFLVHFILKNINIKYITVGNDFHFGKNRLGNIAYLKKISKVYKFIVFFQSNLCLHGIRISSSLIREKILSNKFSQAKKLLGHDFYISGKVKHGHKKGRTIGFPTANISLHKHMLLLSGVYAVKVIIPYFSLTVYGVANIGIRPSFYGNQKQLEVHIFDMKIDLYRQRIYVFIYKKIRNEMFFKNVYDLISMIKRDIKIAKNYFLI